MAHAMGQFYESKDAACFFRLLDASAEPASSDCSDESQLQPLFVRRPGTGRRKTSAPWRSPYDSSVCTVFSEDPCLEEVKEAPATPKSSLFKKKVPRQELQGPCCHCAATASPQWRKGPKGKPILCNACGIRFLRTRSLGKVQQQRRQKPAGGKLQQWPEELDEGMEEAAEQLPATAGPVAHSAGQSRLARDGVSDSGGPAYTAGAAAAQAVAAASGVMRAAAEAAGPFMVITPLALAPPGLAPLF